MKYKRLVLTLCRAYESGDRQAIEACLTPDFVDIRTHEGPEEVVENARAGHGVRWTVVGLIAEGTTVVVRLRLTANDRSTDQIHIYEGRDDRLSTRYRVGYATGPM